MILYHTHIPHYSITSRVASQVAVVVENFLFTVSKNGGKDLITIGKAP